MRRRRLRLHVSSSDDDEENEQQQHQHRQQQPEEEVAGSTETLPSTNPNSTHPPSTEPLPVEISDDDYLEVPAPSSPPALIPNPIPSQSSTTASSDSPIDQFLRNLGVKVRREWLDTCISLLSNSAPGFSSLNVAGKAELCFQQFLVSDMNFTGAGVLPNNVHALHLVDLHGPFVLQVDEIVNISCPLKDRYRENTPAGIKRCLKLSMTDGVQRVFGMEYRPIKALQVLAPAGFKVAIHNVHIRRGLLVLVPEVLDILGGSVDNLEAARQRLVAEVNKPPRGKRTRTGSIPPLASRATLAAWPPDNINDQVPTNISTLHSTGPFGMSDQGATFHTGAVDRRGRISENHFVSNDRLNAEPNTSSNPVMGTRGRIEDDSFHAAGFDTRGRIAEELSVPNARSNADPNPLSNPVMELEETNMYDAGMHFHGKDRERAAQAFGTAGADTRVRISEDFFVPNARSNADINTSSNRTASLGETSLVDASMHTRGDDRENVIEGFSTAGIDTRGRIVEDLFVPNARSNAEPKPSLNPVVDLADTNMLDASMSFDGDDRERVAEAFGTAGVHMRERTTGDLFVSNASNAESDISTNPAIDVEETTMVDASGPSHGYDIERAAEAFANQSLRPGADSNPSSNAVSDVGDTDMADEVKHLPIPNGDQDIPFTYLASLFAKWTAKEDEDTPSVEGKIKCFLTGVKEFHFKGRTTFDLHVYVDDGSLISEILIDHDVVQKAVGYSPKEVTAALSSPNSSVVTGMKEAMRKFQFFLINFEGIMLVEINKSSSRPVALEMNQGCSSSDTWLLLRRLKLLTSPETPRRKHLEPIYPIDISP